MEDLLRSKGLYRITLGKEKEPNDVDKKANWDNRNDEARGIIEDIDDPKEAWDTIESVFGKLNIIRAQ